MYHVCYMTVTKTDMWIQLFDTTSSEGHNFSPITMPCLSRLDGLVSVSNFWGEMDRKICKFHLKSGQNFYEAWLENWIKRFQKWLSFFSKVALSCFRLATVPYSLRYSGIVIVEVYIMYNVYIDDKEATDKRAWNPCVCSCILRISSWYIDSAFYLLQNAHSGFIIDAVCAVRLAASTTAK